MYISAVLHLCPFKSLHVKVSVTVIRKTLHGSPKDFNGHFVQYTGTASLIYALVLWSHFNAFNFIVLPCFFESPLQRQPTHESTLRCV